MGLDSLRVADTGQVAGMDQGKVVDKDLDTRHLLFHAHQVIVFGEPMPSGILEARDIAVQRPEGRFQFSWSLVCSVSTWFKLGRCLERKENSKQKTSDGNFYLSRRWMKNQ
jgi:hypothetical protein